MTISVGGEIGEVGKKNSTVEELRAYLDGYRRELDAAGAGRAGISKVSVQTGTSATAACRCPDGGVAEVKLDFDVLRRAGRGRADVRAGGCRPARRLDAARRAVPPLPGGRDGRDPPRDRLPERPLRAPGVPARRSIARSSDGARRTPPTSASPARPTSSSCTRRARRRSGRSSASSGTWPTKDEILAAQYAQGRVPVHRARCQRVARDGRPVRPPDRDAPPAARMR